MDELSFALTGLTSRGGLSNWVLFVSPMEAVMIDVGAGPAIVRGIQAGMRGQFGLVGVVLQSAAHGPQKGARKELDDWRNELQAKAKQVRVLSDADVRHVRLHLQATAHQLSVVAKDGTTHTFGLMNRKAAPTLADVLAKRFASRFETTKTPTFAFFERYAPFLMS